MEYFYTVTHSKCELSNLSHDYVRDLLKWPKQAQRMWSPLLTCSYYIMPWWFLLKVPPFINAPEIISSFCVCCLPVCEGVRKTLPHYALVYGCLGYSLPEQTWYFRRSLSSVLGPPPENRQHDKAQGCKQTCAAVPCYLCDPNRQWWYCCISRIH